MITQLYQHNKTAYRKVMSAFETSDRTCVVHPTGTGKSYLIAAVSELYKRVLILGPNTFVLDQVRDVLSWRKRGVEYMTYQMLALSPDHPLTGYDLICLDEFHRAGAQEWGAAVERLLELNKQAKVLGTTATPIRYLDNERDMADELFAGNIASHITIAEAWSRGILPIPRYVSGLFRWDKTASEVQKRIERSRSLTDKEKRKRIFRLTNARLHWELSYGMPVILRKHLDSDARRVIVFCGNIESLEQMCQEVVGWFRDAGFTIASTSIIHSDLPDREQREQMCRFEDDKYEGVKLMFSVNMLNEGIHVPNVNAVLMLRTTSSRIIYMQQMGRCLTAANTLKPLVLDMVDNITTTTAINEWQDDFNSIEIPQADREGREPHRFEVKDYTLGVRELIEKLLHDTYTVEERLQLINDFVEQHGRLPKASEKDTYRHWAFLVKYHRDLPEVQSLMQRFLRHLSLDDIKQHLRAFATENDRWPRRDHTKQIPKQERILASYFERYRDELLKDDDFSRLYEYYRDKDKLVFDDQYAIVVEFCQRYDHLPIRPADKELRESVTDEARLAANSWKWLRNNFQDDERVRAISREYGRKTLREKEIKHRVEVLTVFINENRRQPSGYYPGEVQLRNYMNSLRISPYNEREDVKELMKLADSVKAVRKDAGELLEEYIRFCETNKKIPSRFSKDAYEVNLYKRTKCRKTLTSNPRYVAVREKYKHRRMSQDEERRIVMEHCERTGRRPSKTTSTAEVYRAWHNIKQFDKEFAAEIQEKYPVAIVWSDEDTERYAEQVMAFVREHNRRPNVRLDDRRLCNILGTLLKAKSDHPATVRLNEMLGQLQPVHAPKYYNRRQSELRRHGYRYGYIVVKDRGVNPDTRYAIFYTADTKRNKQYEQKCVEAGMEIKEYELVVGTTAIPQ